MGLGEPSTIGEVRSIPALAQWADATAMPKPSSTATHASRSTISRGARSSRRAPPWPSGSSPVTGPRFGRPRVGVDRRRARYARHRRVAGTGEHALQGRRSGLRPRAGRCRRALHRGRLPRRRPRRDVADERAAAPVSRACHHDRRDTARRTGRDPRPRVLGDAQLLRGRRRDRGELRVSDRKKDISICGGFNVSPAEVENLLLGCDGISQSTSSTRFL